MNRSGIGGRLMIAVIIGLIGFFMYMHQSEKNPVTGEKQHVAITPDDEIRLGLEAAPTMAREMGGEISQNDPRTLEVQRMGNLILSKSVAKSSPWKFKFHLLADNESINAFALPGGQVFITLGLYSKLRNEAQLAGVLSHEMGHVIERHTAQQMAKSQFGQFLIYAVGTAASDPQSNSGYHATIVASLINQMFQLRYSRADESQADIWGLKLMSQAGFDPHAMIDVLEILKSAKGRGNLPQIFQTHPDPDRRIEQIKAYLQKNPPSNDLQEGRALRQ